MNDSPHCDFETMRRPAPQHDLLKPFVGSFRAEVRMWMAPGDPMVSGGTMTNTLELGGLFLRQHYTGDDQPGPVPAFEGRGYWGFNKTTGLFEGFWIDTASSVMQHETGNVDGSGRVWTMVGEFTDPGSGKPMRKKSVIRLTDENHHSMEMFMPGPDGREVRTMEILYSRQK